MTPTQDTPSPAAVETVARKLFIVWNEGKSEGVVFVDDEGERDAKRTAARYFGGVHSTLGQAFADIYDDDDLSFEVVDLASLSTAAPTATPDVERVALQQIADGDWHEVDRKDGTRGVDPGPWAIIARAALARLEAK